MNDDTLRRLDRLHSRRTLKDRSDDYLIMLLEDAAEYAMAYTHRVEDMGEAWDGLICRIAVYWANVEGAEGARHIKDGEVEREVAETQLPPDIEKQLKAVRLIPGVHAVLLQRLPRGGPL